jgi:hypothetical protein
MSNSRDWRLEDATKALEGIADRTNDELFHVVTKNWIKDWNKFGNDNSCH